MISDKCTVQPYIVAGIHTFKIQMKSSGSLRFVVFKFVHIGSAWIFVRHIGRIERKWKTCIGVLVQIISVILPVGRNGNGIKSQGAVILFIKCVLAVINTVKITEFPVSV